MAVSDGGIDSRKHPEFQSCARGRKTCCQQPSTGVRSVNLGAEGPAGGPQDSAEGMQDAAAPPTVSKPPPGVQTRQKTEGKQKTKTGKGAEKGGFLGSGLTSAHVGAENSSPQMSVTSSGRDLRFNSCKWSTNAAFESALPMAGWLERSLPLGGQ